MTYVAFLDVVLTETCVLIHVLIGQPLGQIS